MTWTSKVSSPSQLCEINPRAKTPDQAWLDGINAERTKDQSGPISYEIFEIIMDRLEKEWFELVSRWNPSAPAMAFHCLTLQIKKIPQPASHLPVEDSKCAICDDGEGENSNAIVFCDGCNLAVHQGDSTFHGRS